MAKVTVRGIEALKPRSVGYRVTVERGLHLRVAPDGSKTWFVRYRVAERQLQARLPRLYGSRGDEGFMSLAQALAENARIQSLARDHIDFQVQRAEQEQAATVARNAARSALTSVAELFEAWIANGVSRKDGNRRLRQVFQKDVLPAIGAKPLRELNDTDLVKLLRVVGSRSRPGPQRRGHAGGNPADVSLGVEASTLAVLARGRKSGRPGRAQTRRPARVRDGHSRPHLVR